MRRAIFVMAALIAVTATAEAAAKLRFVVQSPRWGNVVFTFDGVRACAVNKGEQMCGTANKVPKPGESFTMKWGWPQTAWTRP